MRCNDGDVMMMQKQKKTKSNLGKNPGALQPTPLTRDRAPAIHATTGGEGEEVILWSLATPG